MDAYQQSHGYTGPPLPPPPPPPPLPSMADPQHQQHHQFPPPPRQSISQQGPWYSGQFQYQPPPSSSPPPPPPHHHQPPPSQQQWAPPPYSDQYPPAAYPPPHHNPVLPYPAHQQHLHNQYPRPHMPPPPPPHQSYRQEWGNPNWGHHQSWEYPVHSNEEDWAARARAWAASKASTDFQNPQSQSTPFSRAEEQIPYRDQRSQTVDPHYSQTQQQAHPSSSYLQFPAASTHRSPVVHLQESASISSAAASYVPNGHLPYTARDETPAGDSNAVFSHRENLPTSPTFHQQEVPSSYSSVTGKGGVGEQPEPLYKSFHFPITSHQEGKHHVQSSMPAIGSSELMEQRFAYRNHSADHITDLSDQPLDFAPSFNRVHEPQMQSSFPQHDTAVPSGHAWGPPSAPGLVYPPVPSGPQHGPSMAVSSSTPLFGRIPGPGFQPPIPSVTAPFGLGAGSALHSMTAYPGEAYGVSSIPDRPKKAAVPNWLREEIIKKKSVIASSAQEHSKEDTQSIEDEGVEKSFGKGDQADSKSIDSSRSTEEEDDDEDYVEEARTAAINQEIKRILTEVLLKVTDELFDEIATKVLSEDDLMVEVNHDTLTSNRASLSPPAVPASKASAKVLIPVQSKESETRAVTEKSSSSTPGDLLGLGSYASDDDDEIQTSTMPISRENSVHQHSSVKKHSEDILDAGENGSSQADIGERYRYQAHLENVSNKSSPPGVKTNKSDVTSEMEHNNVGRTKFSKEISGVTGDVTNVGGKKIDGINDSELKYKVEEKNARKFEMSGEEVNAKTLTLDSQGRESSAKLDKNGRYETERSFAGKDSVMEVESSKIGMDGKGGESRVKQDESHLRKEKTDDHDGSKGEKKEEGANSSKKTKESGSKNYSHLDVKVDRNETEKGKKASAKGDNGKKRERIKDEKEDRLRHKPQSDSSRHKRRRSPSLGSRGRNTKDISVVSHANDTSDEASEDSRRKLHSNRRNLSPSPVKSRRRQLSRSPHSKHSQRRHSPYSSLESTRKRRSRSRSPIRRHR